MKAVKSPSDHVSDKTSASADPRIRGEGESDPLFVEALARGLKVLQCCGRSDVPLTVTQIVRETGLTQSTVWRMCHTMVTLGFLERTHENRVRPGLPLLDLGYAALSRRPLADLARPGMEKLASQFAGAVSLGVRDGMEMIYLERIEGGSIIFTGLRTGSRVSLLATAMGWGYLAGISMESRASILETTRQRMPQEFARVIDRLQAAISDFPTKGYVLNTGVLHPEINAIGIPLLQEGKEPAACLSFGGSSSIFSPHRLETEIAPRLIELAKSLAIRQPSVVGVK
ncbi:MAG: IclR family transcriptional regulator [Burkholderiaceae bacterium]|nr:IclR family transcriptional regulator [Burkholderiaceae bacterium]